MAEYKERTFYKARSARGDTSLNARRPGYIGSISGATHPPQGTISLHPPDLLLSLDRHDEAARLFFLGLYQHYFESVASGRLEVWKAAAHSAIDLLSEVPEAKLLPRSTLWRPNPPSGSERT